MFTLYSIATIHRETLFMALTFLSAQALELRALSYPPHTHTLTRPTRLNKSPKTQGVGLNRLILSLLAPFPLIPGE